MKSTRSSRRTFLGQSAAAAGGLAFYGAAGTFTRATPPSGRMRVAVMGMGRGFDLLNASLGITNTELTHVCDVDDARLARGMQGAAKKQSRAPKAEKDWRRVLEEKELDAVFIASPNHWHAPAAIMACVAGKHVYVEKPCSHNPWEGEMLVAAARKYNRVVQMGNQRRSWPAIIEAMEKLKSGAIGRVLYSRNYYNAARGSIGKGKPAPAPEGLDYDLWQGPAPERPYKDNVVHYNWHWHWHWGNGELGNNGVHALDLARWGLGATHPRQVGCVGGRYHFDDDQESPDTAIATFDCGTRGAMWDCSSCLPRAEEKLPFVSFHGDQGTLAIEGGGYSIYDLKGGKVSGNTGPGGEQGHIQNFFDCVRSGQRPNSEIEEGHLSTLWCHLGNIAWRVGRTLRIDEATGRILNDEEAMRLWKREYRAGWEPAI